MGLRHPVYRVPSFKKIKKLNIDSSVESFLLQFPPPLSLCAFGATQNAVSKVCHTQTVVLCFFCVWMFLPPFPRGAFKRYTKRCP